MSNPRPKVTFNDIDNIPRSEGAVAKTVYNPQGVQMACGTGTPAKTERELEDDKIIQAATEASFRGRSVAQKIATLLDQRRDLASVEYFEKALAKFTS
jgi:hypothetical protein